MGDSPNALIRYFAELIRSKFGPGPSPNTPLDRMPYDLSARGGGYQKWQTDNSWRTPGGVPPDTAEAPWLPKKGLGRQAATLAELGADSTYTIPFNPEWRRGSQSPRNWKWPFSGLGELIANTRNDIRASYGGGNLWGMMPTTIYDLPVPQQKAYKSWLRGDPWIRNMGSGSMTMQMRDLGKMHPSERHRHYRQRYGGIPRLSDAEFKRRMSIRSPHEGTPDWYWRDIDAENRYLDSLRFAPNVFYRDYHKHFDGHQRYMEEIIK